MKNLLLILLAAAAIFPSCKKTSNKLYSTSATINGPNLTMPACMAAYRITLHGMSDSLAQTDGVPAGCGIDLTTAKFPINVSINWHLGTSGCDSEAHIIIIDALQKID